MNNEYKIFKFCTLRKKKTKFKIRSITFQISPYESNEKVSWKLMNKRVAFKVEGQ